MTASMTAFARVQIEREWGQLVWEIRTVNHRYLEPHFRLPDSLRVLEPELRTLLKKQLYRGKVELFLKYQPAEQRQAIQVNEEAVKELQSAVNTLELYFINASGINPLEMLHWPGIVKTVDADATPVREAALESFSMALDQLVESRHREGKDLETFVRAKLSLLRTKTDEVKTILPELLDAQRRRLLSRFDEINIELNAERLEQEMVMLTQRTDVEEEISRLLGHADAVDHALLQSGSVGRRLDFLMQELNREANTLGSKSLDVRLSQLAVDIKVLIEQMREQIQNIE